MGFSRMLTLPFARSADSLEQFSSWFNALFCLLPPSPETASSFQSFSSFSATYLARNSRSRSSCSLATAATAVAATLPFVPVLPDGAPEAALMKLNSIGVRRPLAPPLGVCEGGWEC